MQFREILDGVQTPAVTMLLKALTEIEQKQLVHILEEEYADDVTITSMTTIKETGMEIFGSFNDFLLRILTPCPALGEGVKPFTVTTDQLIDELTAIDHANFA